MGKPLRKEFKLNPKITSSKFLKMPVRFYRQELLLGIIPYSSRLSGEVRD